MHTLTLHTGPRVTRQRNEKVYENPLAEFVELPPQYQGLNYSNLLCGVIRGALEMVGTSVCFSFGVAVLTVRCDGMGAGTEERRVNVRPSQPWCLKGRSSFRLGTHIHTRTYEHTD